MSAGNLNKSVVKALEILELLDAEGALGITEIAHRLTLDKSSVFRALNTLKSKHYVRQDQESLKYSNSYKLFEMGYNVVRETGLPKMAYPFMSRLAREVDGAVNLGIRDGLRAVYIDKIESDATVRASLKIGQSLPLHCTSLGKALVAFMPEEQIQELTEELSFETYTPKTRARREDFWEELTEVRRSGFSVDDEEHTPGLFCLAAPVFDASGGTIAAISVSTVKIALPDQEAVGLLADKVLKATNDFTNSIGGRPPAGGRLSPTTISTAAQVLSRR